MIVSDQVAVTDTAAVVITHPASNPYQVVSTVIVLNSGSTAVCIGGEGVTMDNGFPLAAGAGISLESIQPGQLFAIAADTGTVSYIYETSVA